VALQLAEPLRRRVSQRIVSTRASDVIVPVVRPVRVPVQRGGRPLGAHRTLHGSFTSTPRDTSKVAFHSLAHDDTCEVGDSSPRATVLGLSAELAIQEGSLAAAAEVAARTAALCQRAGAPCRAFARR
jgi:hypothetical protein